MLRVRATEGAVASLSEFFAPHAAINAVEATNNIASAHTKVDFKYLERTIGDN
jgi:hypothetical protein